MEGLFKRKMASENTLFKLIENYLEERFNRFLSLIPYDKDTCLEAWRESETEISKLEKPVNLTKTKKGKKVEKKTEEVSDESDKEEDEEEKKEKKGKKGKSSTSETGTCIYVLTKGKRKDETCDKKVSEGSYCSTHKKHENSTPKSKSVPDTPKVRDSTSSTSSKSKGGNTRNITKHSETDMLWHPQTGIAFSMDEKGTPVVTNKIVNDKVQELKNEDFETVFKWGFPLSEKLKKKLDLEKKTESKSKTEKGKKPVEESDVDSSDEEVEKIKVEKKNEKKEEKTKNKKVEKEESEIESDDD